MIRGTRGRAGAARERFAAIRRDDDLGFVGDDAEQRKPEYAVDVLDGEHLTFAHELRTEPVDDELRVKTVAEQPNDAVDVADGGDFRRADHDRFVRPDDRVPEAELDARGTVDQDEVEALAETLHQSLHLDRV